MTPDLTAIKTPFGLLDEATQQALRDHGGPYEIFGTYGWSDGTPLFNPPFTVRVKRVLRRETVTQDMGMSQSGGIADFSHGHSTPVRVTFDRVDGQIDLSTYRVVARP
ncbi:MAG: hypothetical protein ACK4NW_02130 [Roseinatronobacter sp.]